MLGCSVEYQCKFPRIKRIPNIWDRCLISLRSASPFSTVTKISDPAAYTFPPAEIVSKIHKVVVWHYDVMTV